MAEYRWWTNLQQPFAPGDQTFLDKLGDYRISEPVQAPDDPGGIIRSRTVAELKALDIVGIYTTIEALLSPGVRQLTGWTDATLGPVCPS